MTSFLTNNNDMNASSVDYEMSPKQDGSDNDPNSPGQTQCTHTFYMTKKHCINQNFFDFLKVYNELGKVKEFRTSHN